MARPFERPATIALPEEVGAGLALDGLYVPVDADRLGAAVIAAPHPLMGGSMEAPVVTEMAWAAEQSGRASLRFNWRGVGASGGVPSGEPADADVDFESATQFLAETAPGALMACGYSFGALTALRATARPWDFERMILIAPPTAMLDDALLAEFAGQTLIVAGQDDAWVDASVLSERALHEPRVEVEVIPHCDHFFMAGLSELGRILKAWLGVRETEEDA